MKTTKASAISSLIHKQVEATNDLQVCSQSVKVEYF